MMSDRVGNEFITTCEGRLGVASVSLRPAA